MSRFGYSCRLMPCGQCYVMCRSTFSLYFFVRPSFGLGDWRFDLKSMEWGIRVWYYFYVN